MSQTLVIDQIEKVFKEYQDSIFLIEEPLGTHLTYQEFCQLTLKAAELLKKRGIRKGDKVAIILTNCVEFVAFYFGLLRIGAIAVPINQTLHPKEINYILSCIDVRLIVFSMSTRPLVLAANLGISCPQLCLLLRQEKVIHPEEIELFSLEIENVEGTKGNDVFGAMGEDVFTITFTSGTTSRPKGVMHRVESQFASARAFNSELEINPHNRFINFWPMAYSTGILNNLLCPFMAGASVVISNVFDAQTLLNFWKPIITHHVNTIWLSPSMLAALFHVDRNPEGIKYCAENKLTICVGTAPLPLKLKKDFESKYQVTVFESYGLSELLFISTNSRKFPQKEKSVGHLLPGVNIEIVDNEGNILNGPSGGEIVVRTPFIMKGYLSFESNQPAKIYTQEDQFPTGDIGYMDEEGDVFITGRKKDLIIRGGLNISPRVIEEVILSHEAVQQVCVLGIPHEYYGEEIVAVIQCKEGYNFEEARPSLLQLCRANLNGASMPTRFIPKDKFSITVTGKIQKQKIREEVIQLLR